ncbi:hypothetical protein RvY_06104 [Ramazzottius varieornatus]|uniref:Core Histone H2A/H2B/H3 domain-containing protein n=1 Tax=Ramazzottius varieornatus TaxID=947166 RepID=A0A1D1UXE5_RAMVA|nr:hypothetical protein RvY_06104 [Ramazzottius varieornatus]
MFSVLARDTGKMAQEVPQQNAALPELMINPIRFQRLVREITEQYGEFCFQSTAVHLLQTASEDYVKEVYQEGAANCEAAGRDTLQPQDMAAGVQRVSQG